MQQQFENTPPTAIRSTGIFTVQPSRLARRDISRIANRYWWCAALPVAALLIAGMADWRWIIVALAAIFVLIPTVAMFAWFAIVSRPAIVNEIYPHQVTLTPEGSITVEYFPLPQKDSEDADEASPTEKGLYPHQVPAPQIIPIDEISDIRVEEKFLIISHRYPATTGNGASPHPRGEMLIPVEAFPSQSDAEGFFRAVMTDICSDNPQPCDRNG